jgi:hypothetical protein
MTNGNPPIDPKLIWQSQEREHSSMSVEEVRVKAYMMQTKVHRNIIATIVFGIVLLIGSAAAILKVPFTTPRLITAALMVLISIVIYRAYRAFWSPETLPPDAAPNACLEFYRRELSAQYRAVAFGWTRTIIDLVLFAFIIRIAIFGAFQYEFARIVLPALFGFLLVARYWKARKLKQELDSLNALEKENN